MSPPDVSVLIPSYQRPNKLAACVGALAGQDLPADRFEVLVGLDGPDPAAAAAAKAAWGAAPADSLRVQTCPKGGLARVRNRLLESARGRVMLSINDDVIPEPGFVGAHLRAHAERKTPAIIVGDTPWKIHEPDTLFDRLLRETSMVFFYDRMSASEPERDWGFRHCFGLNFSAPMDLTRRAGGFTVFPATYGYEDVEFAYRLRERFGPPVLFRPEARALHDHFMTPADYLERERKLGLAAWGFAAAAPACARALFGRDVTSPDDLAYSREFVARQARDAERLRASFEGLAAIPSGALAGPYAPAIVNLVYEQHLLLKRWTWRRGLLDAAESSQAAAA